MSIASRGGLHLTESRQLRWLWHRIPKGLRYRIARRAERLRAAFSFVATLGRRNLPASILLHLGSSRRAFPVAIDDVVLYVRPRSSDLEVLREWFLSESPQALQGALELDSQPRGAILDGGANIGVTTTWFTKTYPESRVVAVEPEPNNFLMLQQNTRSHEFVTACQVALAGRDGTVEVRTRGGHVSFTTISAPADRLNAPVVAQVPAVSVESLMKNLGISRWALIKLDIEGAEADLLKSGIDLLLSTDYLLLELRERIVPGTERLFQQLMRTTGLSPRLIGEKHLVDCRNFRGR